MQLEQLAPETLDSADNVTVSISMSQATLQRLDKTVEFLRDKNRRTNRSKLIENIVNETLDKTSLI